MLNDQGRNVPELFRPGETAQTWEERRKELRSILEESIYGAFPKEKPEVESVITSVDNNAFGGKAVMTNAVIFVKAGDLAFKFPVVYAFPKSIPVVPVFAALNFRANIPDVYFPAEEIIDNGFGFLSIFYKDVVNDDHFGNFLDGLGYAYYKGRKREDHEWGKIGMWAYAVQRAIDYLMTLPQVDKEHIMVSGHSRLGKTALWTGATDERIYATFINNSGAGGAAILREKGGERIIDFIRRGSWDWYTENFKKYVGCEQDMPYDAHFTLSLIAPRLVCVGSSTLDTGADPASECLNCRISGAVWEKIYGKKGLVMPEGEAERDTAYIDGSVGYQLRTGTHGFNRQDWNVYMEFAKRHIEADKKKQA